MDSNITIMNFKMLTDILLPEITSIIDKYLNDTDRLRLLPTFKPIHSIEGFGISKNCISIECMVPICIGQQ